MNSSLSQGVLPRRAKSGSGRVVTSSSSRTAQSYGGRATAFRSCHSSSSGRRRGAVVGDAFGTCTRVACAAVIALVLLGDNTSARSSLPSDRRTAASGHHRQHHHMAWQLFAPKARSSPSERTAASLNLKRRTRLAGADGVSAVSPAQMYRVTQGSGRGRGQKRQHEQRFSRDDSGGREDGRSSIEALQSPRSAELLTAYASASSAAAAAPQPSSQQRTPSIAEGIGGVVTQGEGRPALPLLDEEDLTQLRAGQRVQKQTRQGGSGSGSVVVDVRADPDVVLGLLTKYEDYAEMIDTVRECEVFPQGGDGGLTEGGSDGEQVQAAHPGSDVPPPRAEHGAVRARPGLHEGRPRGFARGDRLLLRRVPPDRPGFSRVWMLAKVDVNRFVPGAIVDYAAGRALPRASNWIKPTCEAAQRRKLRAATA